jgi:Zn-dependent metalloprotease
MLPKTHRSHCFCQIVPPYIFTEVARNGDAGERDAAITSLQVDHTMRSLRLQGAATPVSRGRVDAQAADAGMQRSVFDSQHKEAFSGPLVRAEGSTASGDKAADEAYDGFGDTYSFYETVLGRNSIDDEGLPLNGYVHYGQGYDNAFWDGSRMVFGDGDGTIFNRFTISVDVIGHELTHGVTEDEAGLVYNGQSGALNESISDVFGSMVKQYNLKQTADKADWLIGAGLFTSQIKGVALRSMKEPGTAYNDPKLGKDPQPGHMKNYVNTKTDNGGVHTNSGIPNRAFYEAAVALGGYSWDKAGPIWYDTLRHPNLRRTSGFVAFAKLTVKVAAQRYDAATAAAVVGAWDKVGIAAK